MSDPGRTLPDIYGAIATYAGAVVGISEGSYPAPGPLPKSKSVVIFGAGGTIVHGPDQLWTLRVRGHLVIAAKGATAKEIAEADGLIMPLVDAFSTDGGDTPGSHLGYRVSLCHIAEWGETALLGYGGHKYFGNEVFWAVKLHRRAGDT